MEWRTNKDGDIRERLKFAWFPIKCEDGKTRWLENVRVLEQWGEYGYDLHNPQHQGWIILKVYRGEIEIPSRRQNAKS